MGRNGTKRDIIGSKQSGSESGHNTTHFHKHTGVKRNLQFRKYEDIMGSFVRPIYTKILGLI